MLGIHGVDIKMLAAGAMFLVNEYMSDRYESVNYSNNCQVYLPWNWFCRIYCNNGSLWTELLKFMSSVHTC